MGFINISYFKPFTPYLVRILLEYTNICHKFVQTRSQGLMAHRTYLRSTLCANDISSGSSGWGWGGGGMSPCPPWPKKRWLSSVAAYSSCFLAPSLKFGRLSPSDWLRLVAKHAKSVPLCIFLCTLLGTLLILQQIRSQDLITLNL